MHTRRHNDPRPLRAEYFAARTILKWYCRADRAVTTQIRSLQLAFTASLCKEETAKTVRSCVIRRRPLAWRSTDIQCPKGTRKIILAACKRVISLLQSSQAAGSFARRHGKIVHSPRTSTYEISVLARVHAYDTQSSVVKGTECLLYKFITRYNIHDNRIYTSYYKSKNLLYTRNISSSL